jgi:hypothetical protein
MGLKIYSCLVGLGESLLSAPANSITTTWIRIPLNRFFLFNVIRLWLFHDETVHDHLRTFKLKTSDGVEQEVFNLPCNWCLLYLFLWVFVLSYSFFLSFSKFISTLPSGDSDKTYFREFVSKRLWTKNVDLYFIDTHEIPRGTFGIKEVEVFYDSSKRKHSFRHFF